MKLAIILLTLCYTTLSFAAPYYNRYECENKKKGIKVTYSTTSKTGKPFFNFQRVAGNETSTTTKTGKDIISEYTVLGNILSIDLTDPAMMDGPSTFVTLVLPWVNKSDKKKFKFKTMLVRTYSINDVGWPKPFPGVTDHNEFITVTCTPQKSNVLISESLYFSLPSYYTIAMKILFISANTEMMNMRALPWGMACVTAATRRAGHDVTMVDLMVKQDFAGAVRSAVQKASPEVIGISVRNIDDQNIETPGFLLEKVKGVVEECRKVSEATIVLGGAGYSMFPESALDYLEADMGIQSEGEVAFPELISKMEAGEDVPDVPGLYVRGQGCRVERRFVCDLDDIPLPDEDLLSTCDPSDPMLWVPLQAKRGCAMRCSYCSTYVIEGLDIRKRNVGVVVSWIRGLVQMGYKKIFFVDNNFNLIHSYAHELCDGISELKSDVLWRCILHPGNVNEKLIRAMADAGCSEVSLGFESGSEKILKAMNKSFTLDQVRHANDLLKKYGIRRMGFLLLGGPGETKETVEESLAFADSLNLDMARITKGIRIYPDTPLANIAVKEGVIAPDDNLLYPKFYLEKGLNNDGWLATKLAEWKTLHPAWII